MLIGCVLLLVSAAPAVAQDQPAGTSSFDEFVEQWGGGETAPATTAPAPGTQSPADRQVASLGGTDTGSSLSGATPFLLGLLGLAIVLLGLAALPPAAVRRSSVGVVVAERRLEIGLLGSAVLLGAAVALLVSVLAA